MKNGPNRMRFAPDPSVCARTSCRPHHETRRRMRLYPKRNLLWTIVAGLAAALAATDHALAQEPMLPPAIPDEYVAPSPTHHWFHFLSSYDGIPRTYSYIYSRPLNRPRHFRVVGPDGKWYWTSTVRGLPMGYQWLAQ
jgi:hypothetical protein